MGPRVHMHLAAHVFGNGMFHKQSEIPNNLLVWHFTNEVLMEGGAN